MANKSKPPLHKQFLSSVARRRRYLRLRKLKLLGSVPPRVPQKVQQKAQQRVEKSGKVVQLYFPSTHCDTSQSSDCGSPVPDDESTNSKDEYLSNECILSSSNIPSTITLFSLPPEPPSSSKPCHSQLSDEQGENTHSPRASSHRPPLNQRLSSRSRPYSVNNDASNSLCECVESTKSVKEESSSDSSYSISNVVVGRRVVDLGLVLEKFETIAQHPLQCPEGRMVAVCEDICGLLSTVHFICHKCGQEATLESDLHLVF